MPPPQAPSNPDKFAPSNIFAAMKKTDFGKPEDERPQESGKYDALRPLTTGTLRLLSPHTLTTFCTSRSLLWSLVMGSHEAVH